MFKKKKNANIIHLYTREIQYIIMMFLPRNIKSVRYIVYKFKLQRTSFLMYKTGNYAFLRFTRHEHVEKSFAKHNITS